MNGATASNAHEAPATGITAETARQLEQELTSRIRGEVHFGAGMRAIYATDASSYEIIPIGVVVPLDEQDVITAVSIAASHRVSILPRGGGTSLAGQTVGESLVIDVSKHLTGILELNEEQGWVRVQPGVVRDQLNNWLAPHGLQFTPDVSTTNRANVGGMIANNSAGTRSIKYGKSVDQVLAMKVLLADGTTAWVEELDDFGLQQQLARRDRMGDIYRTVHRITSEHEAEIEARYPKVMRRVGGYNLDEFTGQQPFNLAKLIAGSEGTLAFILELKIRLYPVPRNRVMALVHFDSMLKALQAVPLINRHGPSAVELIDDAMLNLGLENPDIARLLHWVEGAPETVLMVEFDGQTGEEVLLALSRLHADAELTALAGNIIDAIDPQVQADVLEFRRAGLGVYSTIKGPEQPVAGIEDAAIPPENLQYYVPAVFETLKKLNTRMIVYGHASVGVLHIRPLLDLKSPEGVRRFQAINDAVFELVRQYGGSWSGEHGDGLARSQENRAQFGDTLYEAFREIKRAFDPHWLMNPGKIVDAPAKTDNLRFGPNYPRDTLKTHFAFSEDGGMLAAAEACVGVGACRKVDVGTMCPSYMATRDEMHSTRGRANVLRMALNGRLPGGIASKEVKEALDLCLECKACKAECPSQVDMAKLKYEFLQHWHDEHGVSLPTLALGNAATVAPLGQKLAPLANTVLPLKPVRWLMQRTAGIDSRRTLPRYARQDFSSWWRKRKAPAGKPGDRRVALFADSWTTYNDPEIGKAAVKVLEALDYEVELIPYGCCGRPQISKGLLRDAKKLAGSNVERLSEYTEQSIPVIGLEPSCVTAFRDDYRDLVPGEQTDSVAANTFMIDQFLAREWAAGRINPKETFAKAPGNVMLHSHCQQKAVIGSASTRAVLEWTSETVNELDAGCCGMAGSFGYNHHDISMQIGEQRLFPAVREHEGTTVSCGFSCRHQIKDGTGVTTNHVAEVLAQALKQEQ